MQAWGPVTGPSRRWRDLRRRWRGVPFAVIAKPCDLTALHNAARADPRIDELCVLRMAMVCGGQSRLTKSTAVLEEYDVSEDELTLFGTGDTAIREGSGWSWATAARSRKPMGIYGRTRPVGSWRPGANCPDALGETADVVALDTWPGGDPVGEDEVSTPLSPEHRRDTPSSTARRSPVGLQLGEPVSAETLTDFQPHQLRRKQRLPALRRRADAGMPNLDVEGFRLDVLDNQLTEAQRTGERKGALDRARSGRFTETLMGDAE